MKEAVGLCSGSELAVGSIVSVLVTVNECLRVESEVPPSDNTTGITAVLVNRNNNNHSTLHWLQYLVTMSSDTRLDSRGAEWRWMISNGREDGGGREGRGVLEMSGVKVLVTVMNLVLSWPESSTWKE